MKQIAVKISDAAHERLQRLAHQGRTTYAVIVENALTAYQPSEFDSEPTSEIQALIEAALAPVLERLATLESLGLVKPLNPEHGVVVTVESAHQEAHQGAAKGQEVIEAVADKIATELAPGAAVDAIEREASLSIPPDSEPSQVENKNPIAFADLPNDQKLHWRRVMQEWRNNESLSFEDVGKRLWERERIGMYSAGQLILLNKDRVRKELLKRMEG